MLEEARSFADEPFGGPGRGRGLEAPTPQARLETPHNASVRLACAMLQKTQAELVQLAYDLGGLSDDGSRFEVLLEQLQATEAFLSECVETLRAAHARMRIAAMTAEADG